ncbi:double-stranded DNA-binding domain-containing protein [Nemania sp. NC0429]|nr:double-stranded DNA-binding domain-containing protein [Nemania sp. NC0429]
MADAELEDKTRSGKLASSSSNHSRAHRHALEQEDKPRPKRNNSKKVSHQIPRPSTHPYPRATELTPAEAEARQSILNQILHPEAADRLGRIRLVKESRATDVENRLITLARTGQLRQKVTEAQLKDLLAAVAENKEEEKIVVDRRKGWDDEDDDFLDV